jgi:MerR family redox-sensitive transcriptional activator SoxR
LISVQVKVWFKSSVGDKDGRERPLEEAGMAGLTIGVMARQAGVAASALRYYERVGLIPPPARVGKRRLYDPRTLGRIRIVLLARDAGFSVRETREFLHGFPPGTTPASRWREMATRKIAELDRLMDCVAEMKLLLGAGFNCQCRTLEDCERLVAAKLSCSSRSSPKRQLDGRKPMQRLRQMPSKSC